MAILLKGKSAHLLKVVFELRYRQGYTYLDRCGRTINTIQEYFPDWIVASQPSPQNGSMLNIETGAKLSFTTQKLDMGIDRPARGGDLDDEKLSKFAASAEELSSVIIDQLGLADFARIGCRVWYLFPADSREDAFSFLQSLGFYTVSPLLSEGFGGDVESASFSVTINGSDRKYKVSSETVERTVEVDLGEAIIHVPIHTLPSKERQKQLIEKIRIESLKGKNPHFAAAIDVDAFREDPEVVKPSDFVSSSVESSLRSIHAAAGQPL